MPESGTHVAHLPSVCMRLAAAVADRRDIRRATRQTFLAAIFVQVPSSRFTKLSSSPRQRGVHFSAVQGAVQAPGGTGEDLRELMRNDRAICLRRCTHCDGVAKFGDQMDNLTVLIFIDLTTGHFCASISCVNFHQYSLF